MKSSFEDFARREQGFNPFLEEALTAICQEKLTLEHWRWREEAKQTQEISPGERISEKTTISPVGDDNYEIPVSDLQDANGVIRWSQQLLGKSWMTAEVFFEFWQITHKVLLRNHGT